MENFEKNDLTKDLNQKDLIDEPADEQSDAVGMQEKEVLEPETPIDEKLSGDVQEPTEIPEVIQEPTEISEVAQEPTEISEVTQEPTDIAEVTREPTEISEVAQEPTDIAEVTQEPTDS